MTRLLILLSIALLTGCQTGAQEKKQAQNEDKNHVFPVEKTDAEWKSELDPMAYYVLRKKGTEPPGSNKYNKFYKKGVYYCAGCRKPLYHSENKYDSGSGWPAFDRGIDSNLEYSQDRSLGALRTEVHCANCGGHLGHVFEDGPRETTGMRHCINSAALKFEAKSDE
ncbi:peptide-methionine (R)-S-oxide reductase MsrB [Robertkochia solimangrovi]|uniref:peptide-methionine (R)-S-oxide reductase MsrB n=1 Tax=Robertkochia solimangrovi TaxID=2213046 RepID=UPI001180BD63|nr:peptide-methionine (R)-S-oxide reductase MsrB [Robertkochia solimangrovi]TRZ45166.1 peptide-methionine (R)-S-oxide reductase [Robertkochia solimangrovi]